MATNDGGVRWGEVTATAAVSLAVVAILAGLVLAIPAARATVARALSPSREA